MAKERLTIAEIPPIRSVGNIVYFRVYKTKVIILYLHSLIFNKRIGIRVRYLSSNGNENFCFDTFFNKKKRRLPVAQEGITTMAH